MNIDEYDFKTKVGTGTTASLEGFDAVATENLKLATSENDLPDFKLEFVETSSLQELLEICRQINP
mgnify:CR=1 FL=1